MAQCHAHRKHQGIGLLAVRRLHGHHVLWQLQSREETLENLRSGRVHVTSLDITDRKVRFYGTTAVVTSLANIEATNPEGPVTGELPLHARLRARCAGRVEDREL